MSTKCWSITHHDGTTGRPDASAASIRWITRYIQPGLELIALDPKRSATIIGAEAFEDEATMRDVAGRAAVDIGVANQEGCANAAAKDPS